MGWDPDRVLRMDLTDIEAAYKGRVEFVDSIIGAVFGKPDAGIDASGANFAAFARVNLGAEVVNV